PLNGYLIHSHRFSSSDTSSTPIYTLSLHDALPISQVFIEFRHCVLAANLYQDVVHVHRLAFPIFGLTIERDLGKITFRKRTTFEDRKSTRLNSSHVKISYAVFCLKKKKNNKNNALPRPDNGLNTDVWTLRMLAVDLRVDQIIY